MESVAGPLEPVPVVGSVGRSSIPLAVCGCGNAPMEGGGCLGEMVLKGVRMGGMWGCSFHEVWWTVE